MTKTKLPPDSFKRVFIPNGNHYLVNTKQVTLSIGYRTEHQTPLGKFKTEYNSKDMINVPAYFKWKIYEYRQDDCVLLWIVNETMMRDLIRQRRNIDYSISLVLDGLGSVNRAGLMSMVAFDRKWIADAWIKEQLDPAPLSIDVVPPDRFANIDDE